MNRTVSILLLLAFSFLGKGQTQFTAITIKGVVKDSLRQTVMADVSIRAVALQQGAVQNGLTDASGQFSIALVPGRAYRIAVSYIGYRTVQLDSFIATTAQPALQFALLPQSNDLKAVTVTATRPTIVMKADRIIVNVAGNALAVGGTALEVIARAPGVISQGDNLQVRSKIAVVLIDGRYTNLKGAELTNYLSSIPANSIDKIEVIANPSAKYDAQGASVINIISAKNKLLGTNGSVTAGGGGGRYAQYQSGITLSHNSKKANLYGSYDYQHRSQYVQSEVDRTISTKQKILESEYTRTTRNNNALKLGLDYTLNKRSSFGLLFKGALNSRDRQATNEAQAFTKMSVDSSSQVRTSGAARVTNPALNFYYKTKLDTNGRTLNITADYFQYNTRRSNQYTTNYFSADNQPFKAPYLLRDNSPGSNAIASVAADYAGPLYGGQLSAGVKNTFTRTDNNILWQQQVADSWQTDYGKTNHFIYTENISAAYATFDKTIKRIEVQAGLRAEQTATKGQSVTLNQVNRNQYFNLFPSLSLGYQLTAKHQVGIGYHKKIERYSFDVVNPFIMYRSQYLYSQGNPYLRPSLYHTVDASYTYNNELFVAASYSLWKNVLADVYKKDTTSNALISTYENLAAARSADLTISHSKSLLGGKWTTVNTLGGLYAQFKSADAGLNNAGWSAYFSTDNTIQLLPGLKAQVYGNYFSALAYGIYKFKPRYQLDFGLTQTLLQKKASLTLNVTDVFNTMRNRYDVQSTGLQLATNSKAESRFVKLVFTYKFGNQNTKAARNRSTGIETEKNRMSSN